MSNRLRAVVPAHIARKWNAIRANAVLMRAAPDLLAALKEARQYVMLYSPSGKPFDFPKETIDHIDAAIARAEGRSDG